MDKKDLENLMDQVEKNNQIAAEIENMKQTNKFLAEFYYNLYTEFKESGFNDIQSFKLIADHLVASVKGGGG